MADILIYSDKTNLALELLTAANSIAEKLGGEVKTLVLNNPEQAKTLSEHGAVVYQINQEINLADAAAVTQAVNQAAQKLSSGIILLSSNRRGKELAGRLAQSLQAGCLTDVSGLQINGDIIECRRNALGGATVATGYITSANQVIAIAPRTFEPAPAGSGAINDLEAEVKPSAVKLVEVKPRDTDTADIEAAQIIVAVGQGLNQKEDLTPVRTLSEKLGGELACSKPVATDKKWLSEERVIGLSGKICKPELAILLGISGQVQFTVGIREAKTIVAVNTDENASINHMADYILTADLHQVVEQLNKALG